MVGTTLQGLRCKKCVSWKFNDDLAQAGRILDALPDVRWCQSNTVAVLRDLKCIAYFTLCRDRHRHDQSQVDDIANRWLDKIRRLPARPAHADSRSTSRASSASTIPSRSSASSHTLVSRSQLLPSPQSTPRAYTSQDTRRYKNGKIDITNIVALQSSTSRRNTSITVRNIIIDSPTPARGSSRSTSRTLSSSSTSTSSSSSSLSSRRSPNIPLTISEIETTDDDTPEVSSDNSSDNDSSEDDDGDDDGGGDGDDDDDDDDDDGDDDDDDDGTTINLHVQKQRLERMLAELEAQIRESQRSSGASTPTTTTARSSHRRSNTPSLTNQTDTSSSSRTERPYVRVKDGVVQRRPITSDTTCYICLESIRTEREATWCRSSCGKNVHHDCFNEWKDTQGEVVKCAFCRSRWTYPSRSG